MKIKLWAGIILVFLSGVLAGSLGTGIYIKQKFLRFAFDGPADGPPPPPPVIHFLMRKMDRDMDLTRSQRDEIKKILDGSIEELHVVRQKYHPEFTAIIDKSFAKINEKLNPVQKEKLKKIYEDLKKRKRNFSKGLKEKRIGHKRPGPEQP